MFVDRDGLINELVDEPPESPLRPDDVALSPGAAEALKRVTNAGWLLVGVSNQPAAAKGTVPITQLMEVHERVIELLAQRGVRFDDFRICCHHPEGVIPELSRVCDCRKPLPGMLLDAGTALGIDLRRSWMIGDTDADVVAGKAARCHTALIENASSCHKRGGQVEPEVIVRTLSSAVDVLLRSEDRRWPSA